MNFKVTFLFLNKLWRSTKTFDSKLVQRESSGSLQISKDNALKPKPIQTLSEKTEIVFGHKTLQVRVQSNLQCRIQWSHSTEKQHIRRLAVWRLSERRRCTLCEDSGTSDPSLSLAGEPPSPPVWWAHPDKQRGQRELHYRLSALCALHQPVRVPRNIFAYAPYVWICWRSCSPSCWGQWNSVWFFLGLCCPCPSWSWMNHMWCWWSGSAEEPGGRPHPQCRCLQTLCLH